MGVVDWLGNGLWNLSAWGIVAFVLVVTHITIVTVTVYLHRFSAHRSVDLHPALQHFFRFWSWLTTGMITRQWTAIHRKHHAATETEEDPHSPKVQGIWEILWKGTEAYRTAAADDAIMERYGSGCPDDWLERNLYSRHEMLGVGLMAVIDVALFGFVGISVWAVQMLWIPVLGAGVINGVGHYWGYRNFESPDASTNMVPWGILIGGEELHNNHHTYPNSARLSQKWWEFDAGWMWIRLFQAFGLARPLSTGPMAEKAPGKTTLDVDTMWAVLNDRFRLMAKYKNDVVRPPDRAGVHQGGPGHRAACSGPRARRCAATRRWWTSPASAGSTKPSRQATPSAPSTPCGSACRPSGANGAAMPKRCSRRSANGAAMRRRRESRHCGTSSGNSSPIRSRNSPARRRGRSHPLDSLDSEQAQPRVQGARRSPGEAQAVFPLP